MLVASTSPADSGQTLEGTDPTINRSFAWKRAHLRRNAGMNFVMTLGVVLAGFWFDAAAAQEGSFGHDHDKWHHGFYQTLERPDTKSPCCNLTDCRPTSGRQVAWPLRGEGQWRVGIRSFRQNLEAVATGSWISRLCSFQIRWATRAPLLCRCPARNLGSDFNQRDPISCHLIRSPRRRARAAYLARSGRAPL